jgi:2-polyprenyl-6-methoxyphenol hydroxylase-like FAD-dependent oxidoreductase
MQRRCTHTPRYNAAYLYHSCAVLRNAQPRSCCVLLIFHIVQEYDMLLGADGVNSQVRAALQAQVKGFKVRQTHVSAGYNVYIHT